MYVTKDKSHKVHDREFHICRLEQHKSLAEILADVEDEMNYDGLLFAVCVLLLFIILLETSYYRYV